MTACASTLERDLLLRLDFDPDVEFYDEQPLTITYHDETGQRRTYPPDVLVWYRPACVEVGRSKAHLCAVKSRDDLRQHWPDYRPKCRAASRYARQQGWRFRLVTERHVRTPYLDHVKVLGSYRVRHVDDAHQAQLVRLLSDVKETDPGSLWALISADRWHQAQL
jgi:TnsA endonuclease-like protein